MGRREGEMGGKTEKRRVEGMDGEGDGQLGSDLRSFMTGLGMTVTDGVVPKSKSSLGKQSRETKTGDKQREKEKIKPNGRSLDAGKHGNGTSKPSSDPPKIVKNERNKGEKKAKPKKPKSGSAGDEQNTKDHMTAKGASYAPSTRPLPTSVSKLKDSPTDRYGFYITPSSIWYEPAPARLDPTPLPDFISQTQISENLEEAKGYLEEENRLYQSLSLPENGKSVPGFSSSLRHLSSILATGTLADRVAALTLVTRESPLHTLRTMTQLLAGVNKKARMESVKCLVAFKELFVTSICPDRKLRFFKDQPIGHPEVTRRHLILWAYEDHLKSAYFDYLKALEVHSHDQLPYVRINVINCFADLLREKPEQEQNLLRLLVNKLGDNERAVASRASMSLLRLLNDHPQMKTIIVRQIASIILRPNGPQHARYYGCITLNQVILNSREEEIPVANLLMNTYFDLFETILKTMERAEKRTSQSDKLAKEVSNGATDKDSGTKSSKNVEKGKQATQKRSQAPVNESEVGDEDAKLITAVLTGVNRAFPFSQIPQDTLEKCLDTLFSITHSFTFSTSVQALQLLLQICTPETAQEKSQDRFYRSLYESLLDPRLITSSKQAMYLNLLFRAMKSDSSQVRVQAFVKRLLQTLQNHAPPFICGTLYLLSGMMSTTPGLYSMLTRPEDHDEETIRDVVEEDVKDVALQVQADAPRARDGTKSLALSPASAGYDGRKREPKYSRANYSCLWEILPLLSHYHPSVSLYARNVVERTAIGSPPDMNLHTITHFLDRFVYRNPKKTGPKGTSLMQPRVATDTHGKVMMYRGQGIAPEEGDIISQQFKRKRTDEVSPEDRFLHRFFANQDALGLGSSGRPDSVEDEDDSDVEAETGVKSVKVSSVHKKQKTELIPEVEMDNKSGEEAESGVSDLEEAEIWAAMKATMPRDDEDESLMLESDDLDDEDEDLASDVTSSDGELSISFDEAESDDMVSLPEDDDDIDIDDEVDEEEDFEALTGSSADMSSVSSEDNRDENLPIYEDEEQDDVSSEPLELGDRDLEFVEKDDDLIEFDPTVADNDLSSLVPDHSSKKTKKQKGRDGGKAKKKALRALPTFASAEDYAKLLDNDLY